MISPWKWVFRHKHRRMWDAEAVIRDEHSDRVLENLQHRAKVTEDSLRKRQRENHWQEAISQMIRQVR